MSCLAAVMQPTYLPWLGYFDLIDQVDVFVLLDDVQFVKQSWHQRNRIKTPRGLEWLTVPIVLRHRFGQAINEVELRDRDFAKKHLRAIELNYRRAEHFEPLYDELAAALGTSSSTGRLADVTMRLIRWGCGALDLKTPLLTASSLGVDGKRSALVATICERIGAKRYLSPMGSAGYLKDESQEFADRGIELTFHHYEHPEYRQLFPPFAPFASAIDLLLNEGPRALEIVRSGRRTSFPADDVFATLRGA